MNKALLVAIATLVSLHVTFARLAEIPDTHVRQQLPAAFEARYGSPASIASPSPAINSRSTERGARLRTKLPVGS